MKKFDIENLHTWEIVEKWNEYCQADGYNDDEIYQMHGIEDFAKCWYAAGPDSISADCIVELVNQVKDYDGEEYYYWCNGNACWFDDPAGDGSPITWGPFQEWLDEEYGEETDEEDE